jgi:hypothetical protein
LLLRGEGSITVCNDDGGAGQKLVPLARGADVDGTHSDADVFAVMSELLSTVLRRGVVMMGSDVGGVA